MPWHNRQSVRLKGYDYSSAGMYFVTICTGDKDNCFGKILRRDAIYRVLLNNNVSNKNINITSNNDHIQLNYKGKIANKYWNSIPEQFKFVQLDAYVIMPNHIHGIIVINDSGDSPLSKIIRWFKGRVTYEIGKTGSVFSWQSRFYDHIIRDLESLAKIREYIANNPMNWEFDIENNKSKTKDAII